MKTKKSTTLSRFKNGLMALLLPAALCCSMAQAQTVLLNPADSGGFEAGTGSFSDNGWTVVGNASNDTWYLGNPGTTNTYNPPIVGARHAYVGPAAGTWGYGTGSGNFATHMYKDITVPAGETDVSLTLKYQMKGSGNNKFFIYVCPTNAVPITSEPQGNGGSVTNNGWGATTGIPLLLFASATPNLSTAPLTLKLPIPASFLNNCSTSRTFRIVFTSWRNNAGSATNNPSAAIDSIKITSRVPVSQSPSTFTINNTLPSSGTNFKSFTDAINWVNTVSYCGLTNAITFNVSAGQTFDENTPFITASGTVSNQIIFQKSGAGANPVIRPTGEFGGFQPTQSNPGTQDYGICLHGADYITFDGIDIISNNALPSPVAGSVSVEYGYLIRNASATNGATNNTIKNTTIILDRNAASFTGALITRGILQTSNATIGGAVNAGKQSGTNDNNSYYNFTIGNVNSGVQIYGASGTLPDRNTKISTLTPGTFNTIGRPGIPNDIGDASTLVFGINLNFQYDAIVSNNRIQNIVSNALTTSNGIDGIVIGTTSLSLATYGNGSGGINNEVSNNQISFLKSASTSLTINVTGIRIQHESAGALGTAGFRIYNNTVSNLTSAYTGTATVVRAIKGLWLSAPAPTNGAAVQYEIINNTLVIDGSVSPNLSNIVFEHGYNLSVLKLRNNLFANLTGAQPTASHYIIGVTNATTTIGVAGSLSNYNDFYNANATGGYISSNNNITSLSGWQSTFGVDANSISVDPKLNSSTILSPVIPSPLAAAAPTLAPPYNRDIMGLTRAVNCTIGAFEKNGDVVSPVISDTTIMGVNNTANRNLPGLLRVVDADGMVANTTGKAPRIYFKKSTEANAFGANGSTFNGWKWVEATNATAPFDFTINYALLQTPVAIGTVIQYFFVTQDTVLIPNIAALPAAGFAGTSVSAVTSAPAAPKSYIIYNTPAAFVSSTSAQTLTSKALQNSTNNGIMQVSVQTGATGDSAYVTEMSFSSSIPTDLNNISAAKVWYTGLNPIFDINNTTNSQFGYTYATPTGTGALGNFTFTGGQIVPPNSTVYFWLTYDIKSTATIGDSIDAAIVSLTYNGTPRTPLVLSPAGARNIKQPYCIPTASGNRHISVVAFNTLNNNVPTAFLAPFYVNYTPIGTATTTVKRGSTYALSLTQLAVSTSTIAFIDYNDNGVFEANETYNVGLNAGNASGTTTSTISITIPCDAVVSSEVRMRIISYNTAAPWTLNWCGAGNGEIQDYTISIADNPVDYVSSAATQFSGNVAPSATGKIMMQLPVLAQGCGGGFLTQVRCNTALTMNAGTNIASAKLYSTGKANAFTTTKLLATVANPSGTFIFTGFSDSLYSNVGDTTFYWITYDMKATAIADDIIDIRIDSINATNRFVIPANNNPVQVSLVKTLNTYTNSNVIHPATTRLPRPGQLYTPALRIRIVGSNTGAPLQLKQLNFDPAGGGNDTLNIASARVFYTGNSSTFTPVNQFGSTYTAGVNTNGMKWNVFNIAGAQDLNYDTNYFWLVYDLRSIASTTDSIDADLVSFTISTPQTPTTKTVTGALLIKTNYCFMGPNTANPSSTGQGPSSYEEITSVKFGSINNSSTCAQTGGLGSVLNQYSDYSDIVEPATILIGDTVPFTLTGVGDCNQTIANNIATAFAILIDWNQNGVFDVATEAYRSTSATALRTYTDKILVPCYALTGNTRMRIIYGTGTPLSLGTVCGNTSSIYNYGETEDYTVNVVSNPVSNIRTSFVQQTGVAGAGVVDVPVLRIAVKPRGCGATLNAMKFTITGTSLADIAAAKLYSTGNSTTFATTTLLGTVTPATNDISFTGLTGAFTNNILTDSTYFWLAYDLTTGATANNILDGKLDSLSVGGSWYNTISTGNPALSRSVAARMAFVSAVAAQPDTAVVGVGTFNKQIMRVLVTGNNPNGPVPITSLSFNVTGGGNNNANIDSARVYYTGSSATFATTTQFGNAYSAAPGTWGNFTINGDVKTSTTTNYFWLVYDIKSTATIFDSVDAQFTGMTFDGIAQPPTGSGAPSGNSKIRGAYCQTTHLGTPQNTYYALSSVTIGGTPNATSTRVPPMYMDFTTLGARNVSKGPNSMTVTTFDAIAPNPGGYVYVYIDYDQNGDFNSPNELVSTFFGGTATTTINYTIPCNVKIGNTRMRVTASMSSTAPALCASSTFYGETEDYLINIQESPFTIVTSAAFQSTGTVNQGKNNQVIMNIKVKSKGCGTGFLTNMYFNTIGSTNPSGDILSAKLYTTGNNSSFNTSTPLGTVNTPNGPFNFSASVINHGLQNEDTTHYWLVYDVSPTATNNNLLDVRVDSIIALGVKSIPSTNSPAGIKTILAPMTISNVSASYPLASSDRVTQGFNNYQALRIRVIASSTGASAPLTALTFNTTGGGNDVNNLTNAKVYYTGKDSTFTAPAQFGSTYTAGGNVSGLDWLPFTISGYQEIVPDTNYFWLTFDTKATATIGEAIDAEVPSVLISGVTQSVTSSAPAGNAIIRADYCIPPNINSLACIDTVRVGTLYNATTTACTNYTNFAKTVTTMSAYAGSSVPVSLAFAAPTRASVFIDLNRNGIFDPTEEFNVAPTHTQSISTSIIIPTNALVGETRMRVRSFGSSSTGGTDRSCSSWNQSETEDYTITILPALPQTTYTWKNAGTSDYTVPANWTPTRSAASPNDILVFNSPGTPLNIINMFTQTVASVELVKGTTVNMTASGTTEFKITGTLLLNDSTKLNGNSNITVTIGESIGATGTLTVGVASGMNTQLRRWVGANNSNLLFPFINAKGSRNLTIAYTFPPLSSGTILASFVPTKALGNFGFPLFDPNIGSNMTKTSPDGYWNVAAENGLSGGSYYGSFVMDSVKYIPNPYTSTIIFRTDAFNPWSLNGDHNGVTVTNATTTINRTAMQGFGQFTLAADSTQNPLPVTLTLFTAKTENTGALLQWNTSSEVNNKGFDLERSIDGKSFDQVTFVKGFGTSAVAHNYLYNDENVFANTGANIIYYRLKQMDFDGNTSYSKVVKVVSYMQQASSASVYPNPFDDTYTIAVDLQNDADVAFVMTDIQGKTLASETVHAVKGNNNLSVSRFANLEAGVYFLKITVAGESQVIKMIKK